MLRLRVLDGLAVHLHEVTTAGIADAETETPEPVLPGKFNAIGLGRSNPHQRKGLLHRLLRYAPLWAVCRVYLPSPAIPLPAFFRHHPKRPFPARAPRLLNFG